MKLLENDEVKIHSTGSKIDGMCGIVCGLASEYPGGAIYIVRMQNEARSTLMMMGYKYSCISLPNVCLERV